MEILCKVVVVTMICALLGGCHKDGDKGALSYLPAISKDMYVQRMAEFKLHKIAPGSRMIIGDSITQFWPADLMPTGWINRGICGDTTDGVLKRLAFHISEKPAAIALFVGVNDIFLGISDRTAANFVSMIDEIRKALPGTRLYIISVLPLNNCFDSKVGPLNEQIRSVAARYDIPWINVYDHFETKNTVIGGYFMPDTVHPNRTGYQVLHDSLPKTLHQR